METKTTVGPSYKHFVVFTMFLAWVLGGIDRTVISFAAIPIAKEFSIGQAEIGQVFSVFFFGYMLMQIPGGYLVDKFGPKKVLLVIVFVWSIFTGATGLVTGLTGLLIVRFVFGLAEAPFSAAAGVIIAQIYEAKDRGKAMSMYLSSSGVVMVFAPVIAAQLIDAWGWRYLFYVLGGVGIFIVALFYYTFAGNKLEQARALIANSQAAAGKVARPQAALGQVLKIPMVWYLLIGNFAAYTLMWGLGSWMPKYLFEAYNLNIKAVGTWQMIPGFGSLAGFVASGFIIDALSDMKNRIVAVVLSAASTITLYMLYIGGMTVMQVIIIQTIVNFAVAFVCIYMPAMMMKKLPVEVLGRLGGLGLFFAYLGSTLAPLAMGMLAKAAGGSIGASFVYIFGAGVVLTFAMLAMNTSVDKDLQR